MAIDASIYSNVQAPQTNMPSLANSADTAMKLSQMGMQQAQMGYQMRTQQAVRGAYANNTDPQTGQLNRAGFLSDLGKAAPELAPNFQNQFTQQDKQQAEAKAAQMDAAQKAVGVVWPGLNLVAGASDANKPQVYRSMLANLKNNGVDTTQMPQEYERSNFSTMYEMAKQAHPVLENMLIQSNIATAPAKKNADLYGSRSPNAELTSQYDKQATPIRSSQMAMNQMIDNYKNPSPQGDASLILNAFKIKFPTAPDVNSLEELSKSQSASDTWKNMAHKALSGGLDQPTRDNLIRDGVSTFRANVDSLRGAQSKYQARAKFQNVNDPTMTQEPAIDKTYADAMALQKQIGPYVPPGERGGIMSSMNNFASKVMGIGGGQSANAAPTTIRIQGPDGKIRQIPSSMKGEAIAAGGSVVK